MNTTGILVIILAAVMLAACGSNEAKDEALPVMATGGELANGGAGTTGTINDITPAPIPEEKRDPQPQTVIFEGGKIDRSVVIHVMDRMDNQGCLYDKVSLTTHKQWGQFVLKCAPPTLVPTVQ